MSKIDGNNYGTPEYILELAREVLGGKIELDPFSSEWHNERVRADVYYDGTRGCGIADGWSRYSHPRTVWCNPPYGRGLIDKCVDSWIRAARNQEMVAGLCLTNSATSSQWCQRLMEYPHVMLRQRISFVHPELDGPQRGNEYAQMIAYTGPRLPEFKHAFGTLGVYR